MVICIRTTPKIVSGTLSLVFATIAILVMTHDGWSKTIHPATFVMAFSFLSIGFGLFTVWFSRARIQIEGDTISATGYDGSTEKDDISRTLYNDKWLIVGSTPVPLNSCYYSPDDFAALEEKVLPRSSSIDYIDQESHMQIALARGSIPSQSDIAHDISVFRVRMIVLMLAFLVAAAHFFYFYVGRGHYSDALLSGVLIFCFPSYGLGVMGAARDLSESKRLIWRSTGTFRWFCVFLSIFGVMHATYSSTIGS